MVSGKAKTIKYELGESDCPVVLLEFAKLKNWLRKEVKFISGTVAGDLKWKHYFLLDLLALFNFLTVGCHWLVTDLSCIYK